MVLYPFLVTIHRILDIYINNKYDKKYRFLFTVIMLSVVLFMLMFGYNISSILQVDAVSLKRMAEEGYSCWLIF